MEAVEIVKGFTYIIIFCHSYVFYGIASITSTSTSAELEFDLKC